MDWKAVIIYNVLYTFFYPSTWVDQRSSLGAIENHTRCYKKHPVVLCQTISMHPSFEAMCESPLLITSSYSINTQVAINHLVVDWLSGTGRLHGAVYSSRNNWFRRFLICNDYPHRLVCKFWYDQLQIYCFIKSVNGNKGAVFLPEARCAF